MGAGFLTLAIVGVALVVTAPPEPTYSVEVGASPDATPEEATPFGSLETDAQREFLRVLQDGTWRGHASPSLENGFVRYKGDLYRVWVSVSESSVRSVLQPLLGQVVALIGGVGLVGRRIWRRRR